MLLRGVDGSTFTPKPPGRNAPLIALGSGYGFPSSCRVTVLYDSGAVFFKPQKRSSHCSRFWFWFPILRPRDGVIRLAYDSARLFDHALDTASGTGIYSTLNSAGARVNFKRARHAKCYLQLTKTRRNSTD
jgi:hypothetical protein